MVKMHETRMIVVTGEAQVESGPRWAGLEMGHPDEEGHASRGRGIVFFARTRSEIEYNSVCVCVFIKNPKIN